MKVIVAGSRKISSFSLVSASIYMGILDLDSMFNLQLTEIVSGHAEGVDKLAEHYAINNGIDLVIFPANWVKYGNRAGYIRNSRMAEYADALIAIWDGKSKGTKHMIDLAKQHKLKIVVRNVE